MTKLEMLSAQLAAVKAAVQAALDANDNETARIKMDEAKAIKERMELQRQLDDEEKAEMETKSEVAPETTKENASSIRAIVKKIARLPMTEAEKALLVPTTTNPDGVNGEAYILPQDIRTKIINRIRDFRSFRDVIGTITTTALTGSITFEDISGIAGLTNFEDGTTIGTSEDPKFTKVSFALKNYGALISMSNTLLAMTDNDLVNYVIDYFAKKAVITENSLAIAALNTGKTVKTLADWKALKTSINKDLDPASLNGMVIVTNQDGFNALDSALDENGRPILQPDPVDPTQRRFVGYTVKVFSNAQLPSTAATSSKAGYAPIYYGNLESAAAFVEAGSIQFATSTEAGFTTNTTVARVIELLDCVQTDSSDECYIYGQIEVEAKKG